MERPDAGLKFRVVRGCGQEDADAPHPIRLLRARNERPCDRAADYRDEFSTAHSIISPALVEMRIPMAPRQSMSILRLCLPAAPVLPIANNEKFGTFSL
jgi:hypothetical protein